MIVRTYKAAVTTLCRQHGFDGFAWQRNYYEHIIRDDADLARIRRYIMENPMRWDVDVENPMALVEKGNEVPSDPGTNLGVRDATNGDMGIGRGVQLNAPTGFATLGNAEILQRPKIALYCSVRCPGRLILQTYDLALELRRAGVTVAGGFHTPMEKECLELLLQGTAPVVVCPARGIEGMRLPPRWKEPLSAGRLLIASPFPEHVRRVTAQTSELRNRFVAELSNWVFVAYASPGGKTERFCRELLGTRKPVLTLDAPENAALIELGAIPIRPEGIVAWLQSQGTPYEP